jgi:hypothetical protein
VKRFKARFIFGAAAAFGFISIATAFQNCAPAFKALAPNSVIAFSSVDASPTPAPSITPVPVSEETFPSAIRGTTIHFFAHPNSPSERLMSLDAFKQAILEAQGTFNFVRVSIWHWEIFKDPSLWDWKQEIQNLPMERSRALVLENVAIYRQAFEFARAHGVRVIAYYDFDDRFKEKGNGNDLVETDLDRRFFLASSRSLMEELGDVVDVWQILNESNWTHWADNRTHLHEGSWQVGVASVNSVYNSNYLQDVQKLLAAGRAAFINWKIHHSSTHASLVKLTTNTGGPINKASLPHYQEFFETVDNDGSGSQLLDFKSMDVYPDSSLTESTWTDMSGSLMQIATKYPGLSVMEFGWASSIDGIVSPASEEWQLAVIMRLERTIARDIGLKNIVLFSWFDFLPTYGQADSDQNHFGIVHISPDGSLIRKPAYPIAIDFYKGLGPID